MMSCWGSTVSDPLALIDRSFSEDSSLPDFGPKHDRGAELIRESLKQNPSLVDQAVALDATPTELTLLGADAQCHASPGDPSRLAGALPWYGAGHVESRVLRRSFQGEQPRGPGDK